MSFASALPAPTTAPLWPSAPRHPWLAVVSHLLPRYGGLSTVVPRLGLELAETGYEVSLAAFCAPGETFRPDGYADEHLSFWPSSRRQWIESADLRHRFTARVRAAEGLHVHGLWEMSTAVACRTARREGKPYVLSAHGMLEPWALANKAVKKKVYAAFLERANVNGATCLHALTPKEAAQYRDFGAKGPIAVVPNAVQVPLTLASDLFLAHFPNLRGRRLLLFLGRLHPKKGLDLLAEAWQQAARAFPETVLVLAGPESEGTQARLETRFAAAGVQSQVLFTGMLAEAMKWSALAAAEGFVLPSFSEGLSMSVLEALGAGVPVLLTHQCNMPQVTQVDAGWEIDPEVGQLVTALRDILERGPAANRETGERGAHLIATRYSPAHVAAQMASLYRFASTGQVPAGSGLQVEGTA